jgi:putative chitinase
MHYDREIFFDAVRDSLFSGALEQIQVDGQNVILAVWEYEAGGTPMTDPRWLAYMLATVYHECATRMWPIEEYGKGSGHEYGKVDPETGYAYYARGFVGLTWKDNYQKASSALGLIDERDLVWHPGLALDSLIAARVMFRGMAEGWFTGRKLGQYFNDTKDDPVNARQIINGNDRDTTIAGYHDLFLEALNEAAVGRGIV